MQIPDGLRYTENHEWVRSDEGGDLTVGISDYAQDALGDVVYVGDMPEVGTAVTPGQPVAVVESTKSVADVYAPTAGSIAAINEALVTTPELVNSSPYADGWFVVIEASDVSFTEGLLDADGYRTLTEG